MNIYKKKVKRHEEVWADVDDEGDELRVRVCTGNSNYGRLYVVAGEERSFWLDDKEMATAFTFFKEIWEKNKDYDPFGFDY